MKLFLIIAIAIFVSNQTFAQTKTDTVKKNTSVAVLKPEFKPNLDSVRLLALSGREVQLLTITPEQWTQIMYSEQMSGKQIQALMQQASVARKVLTEQLNILINQDALKFKADTTSHAIRQPKPRKKQQR